MPYYQDLKDNQFTKIKDNFYNEDFLNIYRAEYCFPHSEAMSTVDEYLLSYLEDLGLSGGLFQDKVDVLPNSLSTIYPKSWNMLYSNSIHHISNSYNDFLYHRDIDNFNISQNIYREDETTVYMTLLKDFSCSRTSGTQATATVNKCLQVNTSYAVNSYFSASIPNCKNSNDGSTYYTSELPYSMDNMFPEQLRNPDIYYFAKKRDNTIKRDDMGMGLKSKPHKSSTELGMKMKHTEKTASKSSLGAEMKGKSNSINGKSVSIKDEKSCNKQIDNITACCSGKPEMIATVSHIQIGPKEPCPYSGMSPCIGPKCLVATAGRDEQAPVKISTMTNPRRGVFELIIRRMTGAPLAKNELMLEWTPPPSRPTCGTPCSTICSLYPCRPSKCKMCRPFPCKPHKCCKKLCPPPCRPRLCRTKPCRPEPCRRPTCRRVPCRPVTCRPKPCSKSPCQPGPCRPISCRPVSCFPVSCRTVPCTPWPCQPISCPPSPCPLVTCTPAQCRTLSCSPAPCRPIPGAPTPCHIVPSTHTPCKPSPCCRKIRPKYILSARPSMTCKKCCRPCSPTPCGSPCALSPCTMSPCSNSPCGKPPCSTSPCSSPPCVVSPCSSLPCKSSPCLRPCPVGYRCPRKTRSQPKIKAHRQRISPCYNRPTNCPVVRCRSGPCIRCCGTLCTPNGRCSAVFCCPRRKSCSVFPFKPKCGKSSCSTCC